MSDREPETHYLKVAPQFFEEVAALRKKQEFRSTADRDFRVGDTVVLLEYMSESNIAKLSPEVEVPLQPGLTGRELYLQITHILDHNNFEPVPKGWAILSLEGLDKVVATPAVNVKRLRIGTSLHLDPRKIYANCFNPGELERLTEIVLVGWLENPRQLFYSSSEDTPNAIVLLERAKKELLDRVELDEEAGAEE